MKNFKKKFLCTGLTFSILFGIAFGFIPQKANAQKSPPGIKAPEWVAVKAHYEKTMLGAVYIRCNGVGKSTCMVKNNK